MGKGGTEVQVQQTAIQNQETNINTVKDLNRTIDGLVGVLSEQAKNPAANYVVPVTITAPAQNNQQYNNADLLKLLSVMYLLNSQRPAAQAQGSESGLPILTILLFGAVVIIAVLAFKD